jgi:hypothetical protein
MKKIIFLSTFFIFIATDLSAQCNNLKTTNRPDGNLIKYFNPKPIIRQSDYEVGVAIYKNETTNELMLNVSVLFVAMQPKKLTENLIIQSTNKKGISLKPLMSELITMNGRKLAMGLYAIDKADYEELKLHNLKSIFLYLDGNLIGSTVTENASVLRTQLNCYD